MLVEQAMEQLDIDIQVTVDDNVAEAGDSPKRAAKSGGRMLIAPSRSIAEA